MVGTQKQRPIIPPLRRLANYCRRKSPWILHLGAGGCLPPEEEVIVGNNIVNIGEFIDSFGKETLIQSEVDIESMVVEGETVSFGNFMPQEKKIYAIHRLKSPEKLIEIKTSTGIPITLTPDHKVMVDRAEGPEWINAKNLKKTDFLFCPRKINVKSEIPDLMDMLPHHLVANIDEKTLNLIKNRIIEKHGGYKEASSDLGIPVVRFSHKKRMFNLGELKIIAEDAGKDWNSVKTKIRKLTTKGFEFVPDIKINEDLMYVLGLIASDGHVTLCKSDSKRRGSYKIVFSNKEERIMQSFASKVKKILSGKKINNGVSNNSGIPISYFYSNIFAFIIKYFGIGKIGGGDFKRIFGLPENYISSFLAGYFDGDGHISFLKRGRYEVGITTSDFLTAKRIFILFKRLGIATKIIKSRNKSTFGTKNMYRIGIVSRIDLERFLKKVPMKHPKKVKRKIADMSTLSYSSLSCNSELMNVRKSLNVNQSEVYEGSVMSGMENGKRLKHLTASRIFDSLKDISPKKNIFEAAENILNDDYYLDRISEINYKDSRSHLVYNISVKDTESYIPGGMFVVKNCNGCSIEILASLTPKYDLERFGILSKGSPRHADILVVEGIVTKKMKDRLLTIYHQIPDPKYVMAVGACAISGGVFYDSYNFAGPLDKVIPVDVYVPGCPPKPEAIISGVTKILKKMEGEDGSGKSPKKPGR